MLQRKQETNNFFIYFIYLMMLSVASNYGMINELEKM
jgi:hypothetical protein